MMTVIPIGYVPMIILYFYNNTWFICKVPCWCQSLVVNKLGQNIARYMRWICKVREDSSTEFFFLLFFLGWQSHRYGRPLVVARIWALVGSIVSASGLHVIGGQILPRRARRARAVRNCEWCDAIERRGPRAIFSTASVRWSGSGPANTMPRAAEWELLFSFHSNPCAVQHKQSI